MQPPISVCIIGYNEEKKVEECLQSVLPIADEIVFIDSESTDKTTSIVKRYTKRIIEQEFLGHVQQKSLAVTKARNDWVLSLDCDERLSPAALAAIQKEWAEGGPGQDGVYGYSFNRLTYYIYRWIRHSGWYPDRKIRLFHRQHCSWQGENPHDRVESHSGQVKQLDGDILHYSFDSISDHIRTLDYFSTIGAQEAFKKGRRSNIFTIIGRSFWAGFRKLVFEAAFLDGVAGLILTGLSAAATWSKYSKLYVLNRQKNDPEFLTRNRIKIEDKKES